MKLFFTILQDAYILSKNLCNLSSNTEIKVMVMIGIYQNCEIHGPKVNSSSGGFKTSWVRFPADWVLFKPE